MPNARPSVTVPPKPPAGGCSGARRSVCPLACGLDLFGDKWTLLIVRDLLGGRTRYKDLSASPEKIATNLLAERLVRLCEHGIAEKVLEPGGTKHASYRLTDRGQALRPVLESIRDWGLSWQPGTAALLGSSSQPAAATPVGTAQGKAARR